MRHLIKIILVIVNRVGELNVKLYKSVSV